MGIIARLDRGVACAWGRGLGKVGGKGEGSPTVVDVSKPLIGGDRSNFCTAPNIGIRSAFAVCNEVLVCACVKFLII